MIRRSLDAAYLWSGYVAAFFLAAIAVSIIAQIAGRSLGFIIDATEIAGFCMAASSFFALAHTFKSGSHVRVTLLVQRLTGGTRRAVESMCCGAAAIIVGYLAFHVVDFALQSWRFGDISPGLIALPFWIPQAGMAAGLVLLTVALVDEMIAVLRGRTPSYAVSETAALD
jgi:TRAP-type C4-dicarboxylate transport system permease small subunit